jgi:glycosyltransferase involved in cell wall biosynthesis
LITRLNVGGPARQALLLTRELRERYPTVLASGRPSETEGELSDPVVTVREVPLVRPVRPGTDLRALQAVRGMLGELRPALLHTHMAKAGFVGRSAALAVRARPRTVHTFHGHVLDGYFSPATQRAFVEVERRLANHTDALVAVSREIRDDLLALGIGRPEQFRVIPLGFDLSPFLAVGGPRGALRRALGLDAEAFLVGIIGRLVPIKDLGTALDMIARLPDAHLAVVGDGECRRELERQTHRMGLEGRIHFLGWWHDIPGALSDVDVVLLTSRNEGTPVSLIEAAAAARPVVATRVGGVPLVVKDGVTGHLAPAGDADSLARLVSGLRDSPDSRRKMGEEGRMLAAARFGKDRLLREVSALYDELIPGVGD